MKTTTRREDDDAPHVQCDQCRRRAYLDDTDFKTTREARASGSFVCNICSSSADLARKLETTEVEATELTKVVMQLPEEVLQLTIQLCSNVDNGSEGETTTSKERDPRHEPGISQFPDNTSTGVRADRETRQGEVIVTDASDTLDVSVAPSAAPPVEQPDGAPAVVRGVEQPVPPAKGNFDVHAYTAHRQAVQRRRAIVIATLKTVNALGHHFHRHASSQQPHGLKALVSTTPSIEVAYGPWRQMGFLCAVSTVRSSFSGTETSAPLRHPYKRQLIYLNP